MNAVLTLFRRLLHAISLVVIFVFRPLKLFAYRTRSGLLSRVILECTTLVDFVLIWMNVQNETMLLHERVYGGNFLFGKAIMVTDYDEAAAGIAGPLMKNNHFMGVDIVSGSPDAFATNSGILQQNPPVRGMTRRYIDENIFTSQVMQLDQQAVATSCREILDHWKQDPKMASMLAIRSTVTRIFFRMLSDTTISKADADAVTRAYIRRFVELSMFNRYLPAMLGFLGTRKAVRQDAYFKLREYGIDMMTIDMTLFAALFSVGTLTLRCLEDLRRFGVVYEELSPQQKRNLVFESLRLYPTVTTIHRVVEQNETVEVSGRKLKLTPGDEVAYPFVCCNRDRDHFPNPRAMDLDRPQLEYDKVLSWSKGPHACPGKEMSIIAVILLLDTLADKHRLSDLRIFNPAF